MQGARWEDGRNDGRGAAQTGMMRRRQAKTAKHKTRKTARKDSKRKTAARKASTYRVSRMSRRSKRTNRTMQTTSRQSSRSCMLRVAGAVMGVGGGLLVVLGVCVGLAIGSDVVGWMVG